MRIAIIGAGIGGLAVAAALHQRGFERAGLRAGRQVRPRRRRPAAEPKRREGASRRSASRTGCGRSHNRPASSLNRDGITGAVTNEPSARSGGRGALRRAISDDAPRRPARSAAVRRARRSASHLGRKLAAIVARGPRGEAHLRGRQRDRGRSGDRRGRRALAGTRACRRSGQAALHRPRRLSHHLSALAPARRRDDDLAHQVVGARPAHRDLLW